MEEESVSNWNNGFSIIILLIPWYYVSCFDKYTHNQIKQDTFFLFNIPIISTTKVWSLKQIYSAVSGPEWGN